MLGGLYGENIGVYKGRMEGGKVFLVVNMETLKHGKTRGTFIFPASGNMGKGH